MKLCYLDESGYSGSNLHDPNQPYYILGGLIVASPSWRDVTTALKAVIRGASDDLPEEVMAAVRAKGHVCRVWAKRFLGNPAEWSTLTTRERLLLRNKVDGHFGSRFEIHAVDLFQGHKDFEGVSEARRLALADAMIAVVEAERLDLLHARLDKQAHARKYKYPEPCEELAFMMMAELFEKYLIGADGEKTGMFIADYSGKGPRLKANLVKYQERGTPYYYGTRIERIIDTVHFVDSLESPCIQLADLCTYLVLQARKRNSRWQDLQARVASRVKDSKGMP